MNHSEKFTAVRNLVLKMDVADVRSLTRLFGAMHEWQDDPTPALMGALRAIAALDDAEILRLARWFRTYVNKWGQVPAASSRRVDPKTDRSYPG